MLELNKNINWYPEHLKEGRFQKGIEQAPDWNISRNRFFATPMPIWRCEKCGEIDVVCSVNELKEKSGEKNITDIHNHKIDHLFWKCPKCKNTMKRISEVFDCWVESGSMPFAQMHYPFENKEKFENNFPAQFISEYISQTRAWFYVLHVLSTALFDSKSYENVVTTGVILNEKGEKMSKSKKNYPDPWKVVNEYGADALRFYLMSSPLMQAENLFFNERDLQDVFRKNIMILWNVYKFYEMYAEKERDQGEKAKGKSENVLDKWILSRLNQLVTEVTETMNKYDLSRSTRPITEFINDLSTWYLRRSRDRFKSNGEVDKKAALDTTKYVLIELTKVMAPFMPFIAETLWQKITYANFTDENKSVHLEKWPGQSLIDNDQPLILNEMENIRKIVELGLAKRDEAKIKVRQPLSELRITNYALRKDYEELLKDELNVKNITSKKGVGDINVEIDIVITEELKLEGVKREIVRSVNALRKDANLSLSDKTTLYYETGNELVRSAFKKFAKDIMNDTLSEAINFGAELAELKRDVKIEGEPVKLGIRKK